MNHEAGESNYQRAFYDYVVVTSCMYILCVISFRVEYTQLGSTTQLDKTIRQENDKGFHVTASFGEGQWKNYTKNEELIRGSVLVTILQHAKKEKIQESPPA